MFRAVSYLTLCAAKRSILDLCKKMSGQLGRATYGNLIDL